MGLSGFDSSLKNYCSPGFENSTACQDFLYKDAKSHFAFTDYLNRENEAVEDVLKSIENEWGFAVDQFESLDPRLSDYVAKKNPTMSSQVSSLSTQGGDFVSKVNPLLSWAHKSLESLLAADALDNAKLTNETDDASQRLLYRAMTVGQIFPHQVNMFAKNASAFADAYFNKEFFRVKNSLLSKYQALGAWISAVQSRLTSQRYQVSNQTNVLNVTIAQLNDSMNKTLPSQISTRKSNLMTTLRNRISQRITGGSQEAFGSSSSAQLSAYGQNRVSLLKSTILADIDSTMDQIETKLNNTVSTVGSSAQSIGSSFDSTTSGLGPAWEDLSAILGGVITSNAAKQFLISDSDLGADSVAGFRSGRDAIQSAILTSGGFDSQVVRAKADLDAYAFMVQNRLREALDALTATDSKKTVQGVVEWTTFITDLYNTGLKARYQKYSDELQAIADAVTMGISGVALGKGRSLATASVASLLGSDFALLDGTEIAEKDANLTNRRHQWFRDTQSTLSGFITALNATGQSTDLSNEQHEADASVDRLQRRGAAAIGEQADKDSELFTRLRLHQIDTPVGDSLSKVETVQNRVGSLVKRASDLTNRLSQLPQKMTSAHHDSVSAINAVDAALVARSGHMESLFRQVNEATNREMNRTISDYLAKLPENTGLGNQALHREQAISELEQFVASKVRSLQEGFSTNTQVVRDYRDRLRRASDYLSEASGDIESRNGIKLPKLETELRRDRLDSTQEWHKENITISNMIGEIKQAFHEKELEVMKALSAAAHDKSDRSSELQALNSALQGRESSLRSVQDAYHSRIAGLLSLIESSFGKFAGELDLLKKSNSDQISKKVKLVNREIADLKHQVTESGPEYLKQFEVEKVSDLVGRLAELNSTVTAMNPDMLVRVPVALLETLKQVSPPSVSPSLRETVDYVNNRTEHRANQHKLSKKLQAIQTLIRKHRPIEIGNVVVPEPQFMNIWNETSQTLNDTESSHLKEVAVLQRSFTPFGSLAKRTEKANSSISEALNVISNASQEVSQIEREDVKPGILNLGKEIGGIRESIDALGRWAGRMQSAGTVSMNENIEIPKFDHDKSAVVPEVQSMNKWFKDFIKTTESELNAKIKNEFESVESVITGIEKVQRNLRKMSGDESKLESEFDNKILPKLEAKRSQQDQKQESEIEKLEAEIDAENIESIDERVKQHIFG